MSVQFGKCNFDGKPVNPKDLEEVRPVLAPYGPDGEGYICQDNFGVLYRAFHTTKEMRREKQPHVAQSGFVLTWDGRLDNRKELTLQLSDRVSAEATDVEIVAAVYQRWGTEAFARLIGDWALSIWIPRDQSLVLAKDFVGTRHMYYLVEKDQVSWSTILDPLVLSTRTSFKLQTEYIAGWLGLFPAPDLTPYTGIHAVPASCFVRLTPGGQSLDKYWDVDPAKEIRYRADSEYEEHFRAVFQDAIRRRLRSDKPVLGELSGGMDSSSIICMADVLLAHGEAETQQLDTVSYYDDSEPNWNERPYFTKVEKKRGREGFHIDIASRSIFTHSFERKCFTIEPSSDISTSEFNRAFRACAHSQGNRVVLSGFGGDEVMGGVPSPIPELEDLIAGANIKALARQLMRWALAKRVPWFHLLLKAIRGFLPPSCCGISADNPPAPWLDRDFVRDHRAAISGYRRRLRLFGPLPSFQENLAVLDLLRRQLACTPQNSEPLLDRCYPFLDRSLLEFIFQIPREQLVRPGQRRSLMRRALSGIVPEEVLQRTRKAFVSRTPAVAISENWATISTIGQDLVAASLGFVDSDSFMESLGKARLGMYVPMGTLLRTLNIEFWLRFAFEKNILTASARRRPYLGATSREEITGAASAIKFS